MNTTTTTTTTDPTADAAADHDFAAETDRQDRTVPVTWGQRLRQGREELYETLERHRARRRLMGNRVQDVPVDATARVDGDQALRGDAASAARPATAAVLLAAALLAVSMGVTAVWGAVLQPWVMLERLIGGPVSIPRHPWLQEWLEWLGLTPVPALLVWLSVYAAAGTALARVHSAARYGEQAWGSRLVLAVTAVAVAIGVYQVLDQHSTAAAFTATGLVLAGWRLAARATDHQARLVHAVNLRYARLRLREHLRGRLW